jgi:Tim17/Tim22/Tim23/Pmp24 family
MIFLFRSGTFRHKVSLVLKATRQHARNLGLFALTYKSTMIALYHLNQQKEGHYDTLLAGLTGGYVVFGPGMHKSVNQQIVIYVFARVALSVAKLIVQPRSEGAVPGGGGGFGLVTDPKVKEFLTKHAWTAFASISWGAVMYLFRWHPETIQPSLRSSMQYMYVSLFLVILTVGRMLTILQICRFRSLGQFENFDMA